MERIRKKSSKGFYFIHEFHYFYFMRMVIQMSNFIREDAEAITTTQLLPDDIRKVLLDGTESKCYECISDTEKKEICKASEELQNTKYIKQVQCSSSNGYSLLVVQYIKYRKSVISFYN